MDLLMNRQLLKRKKKIKLSNEMQLRFLKRLSRLLSSGYPLLQALETIKWDPQLKETASTMIASLKNGAPIDQAFEKAHFHESITTQLYFIRGNNDLAGSLRKCLHMYESRIKHLKKFKQILRYPLMLTVIFTVLLYFIKQSVLPSFIDLFQTSSSSSATIAISMKIIDVAGNLLFLTVIVAAAAIILWNLNKKKLPIDRQINVYKRIPLFRKYVRMNTSFLFAAHLSSLLKTGLPIKNIFSYMGEQPKLPIISYYAKNITNELQKGHHLDDLLIGFYFFDPQLASIFQKNTDYEALERDLDAYADMLTEEIQRKITKAITIFQPLFFIILGCFIIFIYFTLMWPMLQLIQTI